MSEQLSSGTGPLIRSVEEQREDAFQRYLEMSEPYFDKVRDEGDEPWFGTVAERRKLFLRRYQRPEPPAGLPAPSLQRIRGERRRWVPVANTKGSGHRIGGCRMRGDTRSLPGSRRVCAREGCGGKLPQNRDKHRYCTYLCMAVATELEQAQNICAP